MTRYALESDIKDHIFGYKIWSFNLIFGTLLLYYINHKVPTINTINLWYIFFVLLALSLHMIVASIQEVRYKTLCLLRINEEEAFEKKIEDINSKFYKIFDNMCCDNTDLKNKVPCRKLLAPIIPSKTVKKWERHTDDNKIIGYLPGDFSPYVIECPHQLRDILIKLQNNL